MRRRGFALIATVVVALVLAPCQIRAQIQKEASKAAANEMAPDRAFLEWLDALRAEARRRGISESTLNAALDDIAPVMRVIELDRNQPEFTQTFWTYLRKQVRGRPHFTGCDEGLLGWGDGAHAVHPFNVHRTCCRL
jgi:membrane-bound lytic murein transglycosylase B